jgi:hypothetical protein
MPEFPVIRQPTALRMEGKQATFSIVQILELRFWILNMCLFAAPMVALYAISIGVAGW